MRTTTSRTTRALGLALACALGASCTPTPEPTVPDDIFADLGEIAPYASATQQTTFMHGRDVARRQFGVSDGLGPSFNLSSCTGCHERPDTGGSGARYRNFLLEQQRLPDGSQTAVGVNGIQDQFDVATGRHADAEGANVIAMRNPIAFFGVGLLAELPESAILAHADPDDRDGDGISGRPNFDRGFVGRFGRKAQTVSIEGFIRGPLFNHLGLTSSPLPDALRAQLPVPSAASGTSATPAPLEGIGVTIAMQVAAPDMPNHDDDGVPDPELSEQDLFDLVSFSMLLAAPRPDAPTPETEEGHALFREAGCEGCHLPGLDGPRGRIPAYTDLLLHDMGSDLDDGIHMGVASGAEFRTQPLWGVAAEGPYLHDGRADTLDDAIRWHAGEGQRARDAYVALDDADRARVIAFLESLGGRAQESSGLVPPGAPLLDVGTLGGPGRALSAAEATLFTAGREAFDRDRALAAGLGPELNGDSCRACHFAPVIGGAGPIDVDVTRQGILAAGVVTLPSGGSMAHRHDIDALRPPIDAASNFFELRQTPPLFGLGLIDAIPEATIMANEDPTDADGDGVRGRAHVLPDGRIGRLGWKADVPSLAEFTRDGMTNEMGITVPDETGMTYGRASDADGVADPEISLDELAALRFFLAELGAPPRVGDPSDPQITHGAEVFASVGCETCHRTLALEDGTPVRLYSDLLLHDVYPAGAVGISSGDASGRELRTPPLWGLTESAPYMHDGLAETIEAAIARHDGEASGAVARVSALADADRAALAAFLRSL